MPNTQTILLIIFCIVDDLVKSQTRIPRPGVSPRFSDGELIALVLYKELAGIESERQLIRMIRRDYLYLFPELIGQSQFNRRAKRLSPCMEAIRRHILDELEAYNVEFTVIDSTSVPVKHPVRAARSHAENIDLLGYGQRFVHKEDYYGVKLHLLINSYGVVTSAMVTRPSVGDCTVVRQMLQDRVQSCSLGRQSLSEPAANTATAC